MLGGTIYFLIFHYTGFRWKLIGLGIGLLAGLGARWLGKDEGSKELGILAAIFSILGIFFAQYAAAKSFYNEADLDPVELGYEASVAAAKKVITAIPTGSDQEIRLYLAKEDAEEGEQPDLKSVSKEDVKYFRENDLPELRNLA